MLGMTHHLAQDEMRGVVRSLGSRVPRVRTLGSTTWSTSRRRDSATRTFMTGQWPSPDTWDSRFGAAPAHYRGSADGCSPTRSHEAHSELETRRATCPEGRFSVRRSGGGSGCFQYRPQCRPGAEAATALAFCQALVWVWADLGLSHSACLSRSLWLAAE